MKALVVYYTRTGTTEKLATAIADRIDADLLEIEDSRKRKGLTGVARSGWDSFAEKKPELEDFDEDLSSYDIIIVGGPIWAGNVCAPIRSFLVRNREEIGKVAFFTTFGTSSSDKLFENMQELAGKMPENVVSFRKKTVLEENYDLKIDDFIEGIQENLEGFRLN